MIATDVDLRLGHRLREARLQADQTQAQVAAALAITPQQLSKLERGRNAMSAAHIYHASMALNVAPGWFFEGLPGVRRTA